MIEYNEREKAEIERLRVLHQDGIERNSKWLNNHAADLQRHVRMLTTLPEYETRAEDELDKAIAALADVMLIVKIARADLHKKRKLKLRAVS